MGGRSPTPQRKKNFSWVNLGGGGAGFFRACVHMIYLVNEVGGV